MSGRIVGGTETPFLAFPFEVTARPKRDVQPNQQRGVPPGERQAFTALVGAQVITGIAAKVPVVDQRRGPERIRDLQNPVHHEAVQGPFKEARVDGERANNQGLTQEHVDHLASSIAPGNTEQP